MPDVIVLTDSRWRAEETHKMLPNLIANIAAVDVNSPQQFAAGWGTLALVNAGLAQGKNRSGLIWFLASVIAGPVATLVLVLIEKLPARPPGK